MAARWEGRIENNPPGTVNTLAAVTTANFVPPGITLPRLLPINQKRLLDDDTTDHNARRRDVCGAAVRVRDRNE